jgi:hypothetical protein
MWYHRQQLLEHSIFSPASVIERIRVIRDGQHIESEFEDNKQIYDKLGSEGLLRNIFITYAQNATCD